ncbi:Steroid 5-alpha reductase family enzyme [Rhodococcoides kroppenstedtii]|uniref:Steroid 5-alpha reductase family enzyme n=2 Tax=Rhodococcoides kroppenstedtii TaxID=293050 RepID=A0A1I0SW79_9NOCA|nr:Steroid 5-alpha reductase family enzyme [Rhodococcus kroppenstedtii]
MNSSSFDLSAFAGLAGLSLLVALAVLGLTAVVGFRIGRHNVVDVSWGAGFVVIAVVAAIAGEGELWRRVLLAILVGLWGTRLAVSMARRSRGKGEDPRYEDMLARAGGHPVVTALRKIYLTQALALWFVSLPVQVAASAAGTVGVLTVVGAALWLLGITFETVGDRQMDAFKADPANKGSIMDRGLWRYTRHPNYFGDACVWWGVYLVAAGGAGSLVGPAVATVLSPVAMTYFLVFATGARLLERHMAERPGYREYQQRTSYFVPLPPRG